MSVHCSANNIVPLSKQIFYNSIVWEGFKRLHLSHLPLKQFCPQNLSSIIQSLNYCQQANHLADVQDVAAPVHGVVGPPFLRSHVGAVLGEHLAGLGHLEAGVARPALDRDYHQYSDLSR